MASSSSFLSLLLLIISFFLLFSFTTNTIATTTTSSLLDAYNNNDGDHDNGDDIKNGDFLEKECLTTPTSVFLKSIRLAIEEVEKVTSLVSKFKKSVYFSHNFRLSNAIIDCLDLLDLSAEELDWTLSLATTALLPHHNNATKNHTNYPTSVTTAGTWWRPTWNRGKKRSNKGKSSSSLRVLLADDLRSWLSAALGNQDTCIEGFESTSNSFLEHMIAEGLKHVTSLVSDVLSMVRHEVDRPHKNHNLDRRSKPPTSSSNNGPKNNKVAVKTRRNHNFPSWMHTRDRRLLQQTPPTNTTSNTTNSIDVVVAADGSGNFTKIMDAVSAAPDKSTTRFVIYIKRGVYAENVDIKKKKWNLMMIGDGMDVTVITGNRNFIDGWTTFRSATFAVSGRGFIARDLTIENTAGAAKHQAVALRSDSDLSAYYRCSIKGYQDTLYAHSLRQFYRECRIAGTVDFIFGNGAVVFQNCQILARKPLPDQKNSITAQGRKDPNQNTGFSIQFSNISTDSDLAAAAGATSSNNSSNMTTTQTYLGRPWKLYSRTVFMKCYMGSLIRPEGWLEWLGNFALDTLYYGEYMNYGPGAGLGSRVKWPGFHAINDSSQAINFTVAQFIDGNSWLPSTGIKFTSGLVM